MSAIDAAVIYLVVQGIDQGLWQAGTSDNINNKIYKKYSQNKAEIL